LSEKFNKKARGCETKRRAGTFDEKRPPSVGGFVGKPEVNKQNHIGGKFIFPLPGGKGGPDGPNSFPKGVGQQSRELTRGAASNFVGKPESPGRGRN